METCIICNEGTSQDAIFRCGSTQYEIVDLSGNVLKSFGDHNLPSDDDEIGSSNACKFCSCGKRWS